MTEAEWLACDDPVILQRYLVDRASNRKGRLYGCAECRLLWGFLCCRQSREAVEVAERFADGEADADQLSTAGYYAEPATWGEDVDGGWRRFCSPGSVAESVQELVVLGVLSPDTFSLLNTREATEAYDRVRTARRLAYMCAAPDRVRMLSYFAEEQYLIRTHMAGGWLTRDIFGNPFRPVWRRRAWFTSTVVALASHTYESSNFSVMPILADALQDAGCDNAYVLDHCRGPGPHVRGCWVVDLVLGKG